VNFLKRAGPWMLGLLVVAGGVFALVRWRAAHPPPLDLHLLTSKVERGRITAKVTATGTLSALVTVQVGSQVSGRLSEIKVDYNSMVKKGQLIARIDPELFVAAVEQSRANLLSAQSNVKKAKVQAVDAQRQAARAKELAERKLAAPADFETAQATADAATATVEAAESAIEQAKASLHQAEINLAYTTIVSPIDGIVVSRNVDVGQTVAASFQAPTLFVIAEDLRKMQVDTNVSEADVGRLKPGMEAGFSVDAYPGETFTGSVRQIRNSPQTLQNIVTYDAVIDVANPDLKLRPGMTANVTFVWAQKDDVVRIPNAAMRFHPSTELLAQIGGRDGGGPATPAAEPAREVKGGRSVWIMQGAVPVEAPIVTGISDGSQSELVQGEVKPGDALVIDAPVSKPPGRMF
jgi:HlyD family secretion protein